MAAWSSRRAALAQGLSLVPSIHISWFTTAYDSNSTGSGAIAASRGPRFKSQFQRPHHSLLTSTDTRNAHDTKAYMQVKHPYT